MGVHSYEVGMDERIIHELYSRFANVPVESQYEEYREVAKKLVKVMCGCEVMISGDLKLATSFDQVTLHMADYSISAYRGGLETVSNVIRGIFLVCNRANWKAVWQLVETTIAPTMEALGFSEPKGQVVYRCGSVYLVGLDRGKPMYGKFDDAFVAQTKAMKFVLEGTLEGAKFPFVVEEADATQVRDDEQSAQETGTNERQQSGASTRGSGEISRMTLS